MARRPNPEGWKGGSEAFSFLSTQRGHLTPNVNSDDAWASDIEDHRNEQSLEEFDYGGGYDADDYR